MKFWWEWTQPHPVQEQLMPSPCMHPPGTGLPLEAAFPHTASLSSTFSTHCNLILLLGTAALEESSSFCKLALEENVMDNRAYLFTSELY